MQILQIKKHFSDCTAVYLVMTALLTLGISSGIWFAVLSRSGSISLVMVTMLRCVSINFWECFFSQLWILLFLFVLVWLSAFSKYTAVFGYISLFFMGVVVGASLAEGFSLGFLQGVAVLAFSAALSALLIYINVVNYCFRNLMRASLPGYKGGNKQARITVSCAVMLILLNALCAYITVLINKVI